MNETPKPAAAPETALDHLLDSWASSGQAPESCVLGVSGGGDSVALWHGLLRLQIRVNVCHVNHGWRGEESDRDESFVRDLATQWQCRLAVHRLLDSPPKSETEARNRRLSCFAHTAHTLSLRHVVLAHHAEDQAETILLALLRGAGLRGLSGMKAARQFPGEETLRLLRPLLNARRRDLEAHLTHYGLKCCDDSTNRELFTPRNRLRHNAWQALQEVWNRDPLPPILRFAAAARRDEECLSALADGLFRAAFREGKLHASLLRGQPEALRLRVIDTWLRRHDFSPTADILERTAMLLQKQSGPAAVSLPGNRRARRTGGWIWIEEPSPPLTP